MYIKGLDKVTEEDLEKFLHELLLLEQRIEKEYAKNSKFDPTQYTIGLGYQSHLIQKIIRIAEVKLHIRLATL